MRRPREHVPRLEVFGMSKVYKVGQVWEKDGRRREVVRIESFRTRESVDSTAHVQKGPGERYGCFHLWWRKDTGGAERKMWCSSWMEWARRATLVRDTDELLTAQESPQ